MQFTMTNFFSAYDFSTPANIFDFKHNKIRFSIDNRM